MQDMFEQAKRVASTAVERAAWEADKLRRSSARQRDVELAQRERTALLEQLAATALDLEQRGQLEGPLKALAQRLRALDGEIGRGKAEADAIRAEPFTPGSISISVTRSGAGSAGSADYGPCPTCGHRVRTSATYCSSCGARLR
jgi:predicted amidophosphoribosyltransferase